MALKYLLEQQRVIDTRIYTFLSQAQCARGDGDQFRLRGGVSAGEEGDLMAHLYELFSEIGDHAFGSPIEARRNTLVKRCYLSDFQCGSPFCSGKPANLRQNAS